MIAPIRWIDIAAFFWGGFVQRFKGIFSYLKATIADDFVDIRWVLPMAFLIAYCIFIFYSGICVVMEQREARAGRYHGLDAISYVVQGAANGK